MFLWKLTKIILQLSSNTHLIHCTESKISSVKIRVQYVFIQTVKLTFHEMIVDNLPLPLFQLWIISGPAFFATLMATFGVWSSVPPTPPTASAAEDSEPFFKGLKQVIVVFCFYCCFHLWPIIVSE